MNTRLFVRLGGPCDAFDDRHEILLSSSDSGALVAAQLLRAVTLAERLDVFSVYWYDCDTGESHEIGEEEACALFAPRCARH